jgi:hypothetical protein
VSAVHGSTVDHTEGVCPVLIRIARARSNGRGRERERGGGTRAVNRSAAAMLRRKFTGAALDRATGHHFVCERALHVAEKHVQTHRGSGGSLCIYGGRHRKGATRGSPACGRRCCGVRSREKLSGRRCSPREEEPGVLARKE